jgi:hypothetical protein
MSNNGVILNNFIGGSYVSDVKMLSTTLSDNLFSENIESQTDTYTKQVLRSVEGTTSAAAFGDSGVGCRGLYWSSTGPAPDFGPQLYACFNNKVYRIDSEFNKFEIGTVGDNSTVIRFNESGGVNSHLCVVDGYNLYTCPLSASNDDLAFKTITLPNMAGLSETPIQPTDIAFIGGRIVLNNSLSDQCYYTDLYAINGAAGYLTSAFNDLNYFTAENISDKINAIISINNVLWVFGPRSYQVYQSRDNQFNPFITVSTAGNQIGCKAPKSVVAIGNQVFWLGSSNSGENTVFIGQGINDVSRISTNVIEREIGKMIDSSDAIGQTYSKDGHTFYAITFVSADKTFVYDLSTKEWHNRSSRDRLLNIQHLWEPQYATLAYGKIMFGSYNGQALVYLDDDKYTEYDGRPIVRTRISPVIISQFSDVVFHDFELEVATGLTKVQVGQGSNPKVMLQVSKNGGNSWSNEIWKDLGKTGEYSYRCKWTGLGLGRLFVIKVVISDPVKVMMVGAKCRFEQCNSF